MADTRVWNPDCTSEPCGCPGEEIGQRACAHCGEPLSVTHQRRWPDSKVHATCASQPMVDGVCLHAGCCCVAHRLSDSTQARVWTRRDADGRWLPRDQQPLDEFTSVYSTMPYRPGRARG